MLRIAALTAIVSLVAGTVSIDARQLPRPCDTYTNVAVDTVLDINDQASRILYRSIGQGGPKYPIALRNSRIEGSAQMSFVIDTLGRVIRHTAQITEESDRAFGHAVCEFLTGAKFAPISVNGRLLTTSITNASFKFAIGPP